MIIFLSCDKRGGLLRSSSFSLEVSHVTIILWARRNIFALVVWIVSFDLFASAGVHCNSARYCVL